MEKQNNISLIQLLFQVREQGYELDALIRKIRDPKNYRKAKCRITDINEVKRDLELEIELEIELKEGKDNKDCYRSRSFMPDGCRHVKRSPMLHELDRCMSIY